jgi:hypothetical protein
VREAAALVYYKNQSTIWVEQIEPWRRRRFTEPGRRHYRSRSRPRQPERLCGGVRGGEIDWDRPQLLLPPLQAWRFHDESTFRSLCRKQLILNDLMNWA